MDPAERRLVYAVLRFAYSRMTPAERAEIDGILADVSFAQDAQAAVREDRGC